MQQEKAAALIEQAQEQVNRIARMERDLLSDVSAAEHELRLAQWYFEKKKDALTRMHGQHDQASNALRHLLNVSMHPTSVLQDVEQAAVMVAIAEAQAIEIQREVEARIP